MQIPSADELNRRALALEAVRASQAAARLCDAEVYLVGGVVRDLLLGRQPLDVDLAIDGDPLALAAALGAGDPAGGAASGLNATTEFGTVSVNVAGVRYDIARTRGERYPRPGALPVVGPAGLDTDLLRRDFSVNAIALGLSGPRVGEVVQAPGALDDLAHGRLAILHPQSFADDPTRLLRLARYHARLGFQITPRTRAAATAAIASDALRTVSGTRIGNDLRLLAREPDPVGAFRSAEALGLPWRLDGTLAAAALRTLPKDGRSDIVALALVFTHARPRRDALLAELDRLSFTAGDRDAIAEGALEAGATARRLKGAHSGAQKHRAVSGARIETVALAAALGAGSSATDWLEDLRHRTLAITGADLLAQGVSEGPEIGRALQAATDALMDGIAPDRDSQLAVALGAAR